MSKLILIKIVLIMNVGIKYIKKVHSTCFIYIRKEPSSPTPMNRPERRNGDNKKTSRCINTFLLFLFVVMELIFLLLTRIKHLQRPQLFVQTFSFILRDLF